MGEINKEPVDIPDEVPVKEYARYWLPGWLYDVLKWFGLLAIPACAAIYTGLASVWGWPAAGEVAQTASHGWPTAALSTDASSRASIDSRL